MIADYPTSDESALDAAAEAQMNLVRDIITQVRNYRAEEKVPASQQISATIAVDGAGDEVQTTIVASFHEAVSSEAPAIRSLARISGLTLITSGEPTPEADATQYALLRAGGGEAHGYASARIWLHLAGITPQGQDHTKLEKELTDLLKQLDRLAGQLGNDEFRAKAPAEVRQRMESQQQAHLNRKGQLEELLAQLG